MAFTFLSKSKITHALVYQYGKVGSRTILSTIQKSNPEIVVHHCHFLTDSYIQYFEQIIAFPDTCQEAKSDLRVAINATIEARRMMNSISPSQLCVITGFRDPLERAISAYLHNIHYYLRDLTFGVNRLEEEVMLACEKFDELFNNAFIQSPSGFVGLFSRWLLGASVFWFEEEFYPTFGVNMYSKRLGDKEVIRIKKAGTTFIFYRFESFTRNLKSIISSLPIRKFQQSNDNISEEKPYGALLKEFRRRFNPSPEMLDFFYNSRFYKHFYKG